MKKVIYIFVVVFVLLAMGAVPVYAHGYVRGGIWIGPGWGWGTGWGWGGYYSYPYYSYPYYASPPVVIQQQTPTYQERAPQQDDQQYYWYFCPDSKTYYPYVKHCPGGWLKVVPAPAPPK